MKLRFDDSLETVLSADMSTPFGAQSAWRQLVDLIGRRRTPPSDSALAKLKAIRVHVPPPVRAASARAVAFADPPAALVQLFADDEPGIAAVVLRTARLRADEWTAMLPGMTPSARSILRHRRDLPPAVNRALESFGSVDFVLSASDTARSDARYVAPVSPEPETDIGSMPARDAQKEEPHAGGLTISAPAESTFVSIASVALGLPVVAEALRQSENAKFVATPEPVPSSAEVTTLQPPSLEAATGMFQIAELVARIDAYQRQRRHDEIHVSPLPLESHEAQPELFDLERIQSTGFRFETDATGVVRWIEGAARTPLIGLSLDLAALPSGSRVDGVAAGAFRRRAGFANARLVVDGTSDAAGQWRISGVPVFNRESGRFTGYRGSARRPRSDESAEPIHESRNTASDALRQLVHELRTPTNAIAGFAEMIESQMLGPVPQPYRAQAATIRSQAGELLTAIDDIDMAARIESNALDLRPCDVPVAPLLARIVGDLAPLASLRGTTVDIRADDGDLAIAGDDRAIERLIARLMATLVASGGAGERIGVTVTADADTIVALVFDRPRALAAYAGDALLMIDAETEAEREGAPLLGTGFALRLARNLAAELRGSLVIGDKALTLRLPAAVIESVEQVSSS